MYQVSQVSQVSQQMSTDGGSSDATAPQGLELSPWDVRCLFNGASELFAKCPPFCFPHVGPRLAPQYSPYMYR